MRRLGYLLPIVLVILTHAGCSKTSKPSNTDGGIGGGGMAVGSGGRATGGATTGSSGTLGSGGGSGGVGLVLGTGGAGSGGFAPLSGGTLGGRGGSAPGSDGSLAGSEASASDLGGMAGGRGGISGGGTVVGGGGAGGSTGLDAADGGGEPIDTDRPSLDARELPEGGGDSADVPASSEASSEGEGDAVDARASADAADAIEAHTVSSVPDYLIVAADNLAASAKRYRDFRRAGGFNVDLAMVADVVGDAADAASAVERMITHVRARFQARDTARPMYLLLFGDAQGTWPGDRSGVPSGTWRDPTGSSSVVSDNLFADMDGDDVPDLAVGRITADSDTEADLVRAKVADYESTREAGEWNRRINIFASTSGMGALVDQAIESVVYDITDAVPYDFDETMTYARQTSPYVYVPELFSDQVYRRINEGSLLVAYVGHGSPDGFAKLDWNGTAYPILDTGHLDKLDVSHRSPILLFVACSTGAFAGAECISEKILSGAKAPTAILSSTEVSDPYANALFTYEVSQALTAGRAPTIGDAFLQAKRRMLTNTDSIRQKIELLAALLVTGSAKDALKHSHLHMYTLFGDPGMAVSYPGSVAVAVGPTPAGAGTNLTVTATLPALVAAGEATVTLESARRTIVSPIATVPPDGDATRDSVIMKNYENANNKVVAGAALQVAGSSLSATLTVPANLPVGQYYVKVLVRAGSSDYAGSTVLTVN
jgi:hypothetical protein